ncbi:hypothetical protein HUJ04_003254, partial [Dendroctonus ponderosae]
IIGAAIFALCLWLRFEPGINEWLTILNASNFYIGIYILVIVAAIIMVVSFLGCLSSLQENATIILGIIGAAIFALCLWLRFEPGINEWLTILNASNFYIGIYILVIVAAIIMVVSFLGCLSSLQENATIILGVS